MKAIFDGDEHEIDARRVTLVFNTSFGESQYPGRTMVTPEMSLDKYRAIPEIDPLVAALFRVVVPDFPGPVVKKTLDDSGVAFRQVAGMFAATLELILQKKQFGWKYPEANLHPKYQANLGDAAVLLSDRPTFEKFVRMAQ